MNRKDYLAKRNTLLDEAETLLNEGKVDEAEAKEQEIKALDAEFEKIARAQANMVALKGAAIGGDVVDMQVGGENASGVDTTGTGNGKNQFKSLGEQLRAVVIAEESKGRTVDDRLIYNQLGMSEGVPGDGGYLVQHEFSRELLKRAYETGILGNYCRRQPIGPNSNGFKINVVDETSRATGSRMGGIQMYWTPEGGQKTASQPKFRQLELSLQKLTGLLYATDELLADSVALEAFIMDAFAEEYGFMVDDAIIDGTGAGMPLGILRSNALVTVPAEAGQVAGTVQWENLSNMWGRLPARSRRNAIWLTNQEVEPQLDRLSIPAGTAALEPRFVTYGPDGTLRIKGRPVVPIEQANQLGAAGDIILADLSQYLLIDKGPMESAVSIHVRFVWDEQTFRFVYRANGQPIWNRPLTPYKGSNQQSPFVALAARQ